MAWSHSQVVEWIFGSRIQSHWPCRTLWPSSMFSRILATASASVPATSRREQREQQRAAAGHLQAALDRDDPVDVARVGLAAAADDLGAERVEFGAEGLDLLGGEVGGGAGASGLAGAGAV